MIKKIIIGMMMCNLLLFTIAGCGKEQATAKEVAMGRYIEKEVTIQDFLSEASTFLVKTKANHFQYYQFSEAGLTIFEEQEDLSWKQLKPTWLTEFNDQYKDIWVCAMTLDEKDEPCFVHNAAIESTKSNTEEETDTKAFSVNEDGEADVMDMRTKVIRIEENKIKENQLNITGELPYVIPNNALLTSNGDLIIAGNLLDPTRFSLETGNEVKKYSEETWQIAYLNEKLYTINLNKSQIDIYNLDNNQLESSIPCSGLDENSILVLGDKNDMYLVSREGIQHYTEGGNVWEKLVEGNGLSLGLPSNSLVKATVKDGRILVFMINERNQNLVREYVYSETTPTLPTMEFSAYTLEESATFQEALTAYQLAHPEVRINLQVGLKDESGMTKEDAIKTLNTEILAGQGPDLILLDGLPQATYIEKGALADLSSLTEKEQLFPFVLKPFIREKQFYAMPLRFTVPSLWGDAKVTSAVDSIEALGQYQASHTDEEVIYKEPAQQLIRRFASSYEGQWFNEKGELQEEQFIHFLDTIHKLAIKEKKEEDGEDGTSSYHSLGMLDTAFRKVKVYSNNADSILNLLIGTAVNERKGNSSFTLLKDGGKRFCEPHCLVSINQNSKNKEALKEIVNNMLSEKLQLTDTGEGFPTRGSAFEKWIKGDTTSRQISYGFGYYKGESLFVQWGHEEVLNAFGEEVKRIEEAKIVDETLINLVIEGTKPYFNGEQSAQEVTSVLKPQLELYMQE